MTVLHLCAKIGNLTAAKIILESYRDTSTTKKLELFLNSTDDGHWTALCWAAENKHKEFVSYMISLGADVNVCDMENNTVIHWAALSGDVETLYPLLSTTCDVNIQNVNGDTAL
jgi:euchromatic histone-lysine N-methyltransferase